MQGRKLSLSFILSIFWVVFAFGQQTTQNPDSCILSGIIKDTKTKSPLAFVDIYFIGAATGLTSDIDGKYSIKIAAKTDTARFSSLGYKTKRIVIKPKNNQRQELNIYLKEETRMLKMATVTAKRRKKLPKDTIAIRLWRNVVKNKADNQLSDAKTYHYEDYTKIEFRLAQLGEKFKNNKFLNKKFGVAIDHIQQNSAGEDYLPLLMKETVSDVYYRKEPKFKKTIIKADQFSGFDNESISAFTSEESEELNIYDNLIILVGKSFIGPFGKGANSVYRYFLTDTIKNDTGTFYKLDFVGRRKQDLTFLGSAWIHDSTFAISKIEMEISKNANLNFLKIFRLVQEYDYVDGYWVQNKGHNSAMVVIPEKMTILRMGIERHSSRRDIQINIPLSDSLFGIGKKERLPEAFERDEEYWASVRHDTLPEIEQGTYDMIDSVQRTGFYKFMDWSVYTLTSMNFRCGPIEFGRIPEFVSWNNIEGIRTKLRVRTTKKFSQDFQAATYAAYGFRDKEWKYGLAINVRLPAPKKRWHVLALSYKYDFEMIGQQHRYATHDNISTSFSRSNPIDKLMKVRDIGLSYSRDWFDGFYNILELRRKTFYSVPDVFEFSSGEGANQVSVDHFETSEVSLTTHWGYKESFFSNGFVRQSLGSKFPVLDLIYTAGLKGVLGSDYAYHKLDFILKHRWSTPLGVTKYQIRAGKTFGEAPYPLLKIHLGSESYFLNGHAYNLMNEFEFASDEYAALWLEHHFDGLILNSIPLIKKLQWRTFISFKGLFGRVSDTNRALINMPSTIDSPNFYAELGFGVENIFKVFRVDFLWRLTQPDKPLTRGFAFKFSLAPNF